jgi:hypothetical protein
MKNRILTRLEMQSLQISSAPSTGQKCVSTVLFIFATNLNISSTISYFVKLDYNGKMDLTNYLGEMRDL